MDDKHLSASPFVPYDKTVYTYVTSEGGPGTPPNTGGLHPFEYNGWWDEMLSYYDTCYIHAGLNPGAIYRLKGPNALAFLNQTLTNGFSNFKVGTGKHGIICNEEGKIVKDGVLLRMSDDEFLTYWMWPAIEYHLQKSGMDVEGENMTGKIFFYQMAGPKTLDVLEEACGESIRDIKFFNFRYVTIAGKRVFLLRIGMAGSLAFEIHGNLEDALDVYNEICSVGEKYGIQRLGRHAYRNTHTEGGFPQNSIHFCPPIPEPGLAAFTKEHIMGGAPARFPGSAGPDHAIHTRNPIELGWSKAVVFDHDFPGRAALEKEMEHPSSHPMTLVWNKEDICDVWMSVFEDGEPYKLMPLVEDVNMHVGSSSILTDKVMLGDVQIGISSGRMFSPKCREMISLGAIKPEYCIDGTEVVIVWGDPGKRQKNIRATLKSWPYLTEARNEDIDLTKLP